MKTIILILMIILKKCHFENFRKFAFGWIDYFSNNKKKKLCEQIIFSEDDYFILIYIANNR